jgi:hypothetical protein
VVDRKTPFGTSPKHVQADIGRDPVQPRPEPPFTAEPRQRPPRPYERLDGGYFLVSTYETAFGNEPAQRGVNYWGYDAEAQRFHIIFFSNNGPFTEEGNRYEGKVAGSTLTFEGPARFQYDLDDAGKVKLNADGTMSVAWWLRDEHGDWQTWMENTFTRLRD